MAELTTFETLAAQEPPTFGTCKLSVLPEVRKTWLAPWPKAEHAFSKALEHSLGVAFPEPGQCLHSGAASIVWAGRSAAILLEAEAPADIAEHGAVVDVSDGWSRFRLEGRDAAAVMARLCPVDLRPELYMRETVLRTQAGHVSTLVIAGRPESIELWSMRSFAAHLHEELLTAMHAVAARSTIGR